MKSKLNEFKTPSEGNPRFNEGIRQIDCGGVITISCSTKNCNVIVFTDSEGVSKSLFASPLLVTVRNAESSCNPLDYRKNNLQKPYVAIRGILADVNNFEFTTISFDVYPENGQTVESLETEILDAICACVGGEVVTNSFDNGIAYNEGTDTWGFGGGFERTTTIAGNSQVWAVGYLPDLNESRLAAFALATEADIQFDSLQNVIITAFDVVVLASEKIQHQYAAFHYWGDPNNPAEGDWRYGLSGADFVFERYEGAAWVQKGIFVA